MVEKENVDTQSVALIGLFGAIVTLVLILGIQVLYFRMTRTDTYKKSVLPGNTELKDMLAEQTGALSAYKWVDRERGRAAVPIDRAMDLVVEDLRMKRH